MKNFICSVLGAVGGFIAWIFGGWNASLTTLLIFMCVDFVSGVVVAGVFKASPKTESGALESRIGWKGICRKVLTFVFVILAYRLDLVIGTSYIKDAVCLAFIANELLSIIENAGLMGLPIPKVIKNAIDILKNNAKENNEND